MLMTPKYTHPASLSSESQTYLYTRTPPDRAPLGVTSLLHSKLFVILAASVKGCFSPRGPHFSKGLHRHQLPSKQRAIALDSLLSHLSQQSEHHISSALCMS